jgi:transmembrane sensor
MTDLRFPLKECLEDPVDEAALNRIAQRMDTPRPPRYARKIVPFVFAGAVTALIAIAATSAIPVHRAEGPLAFADGRAFTVMDATSTSREFPLSDGSRIRLWPGAHLEPLESSGTAFSAIVTQGRVDFEVRPGGPRRWTVECGLATVEVVGTAFTCDRAPNHLRVEVRHGVVLARGDRVPDRARKLSAGEFLEISDRNSTTANVTNPVVKREEPILPPVPNASASVESNLKVPRSSTQPWRELARHGHPVEAYEVLGTDGIRSESKKLGVSDLLALADVARLSGHPAEAVVPLQRVLAEFSSDAQAPLAAFALGRLELDTLGHARAAVSALSKALALGIPRGLREDVYLRLVEAYAKSGDSAGAKRAKDAYLEQYPHGRHVRSVHYWTSEVR